MLLHKPYNKFKGWLVSNNITYTNISADIGVSVATISAKVNGKSDFTLAEVDILSKKYPTFNLNIFFGK